MAKQEKRTKKAKRPRRILTRTRHSSAELEAAAKITTQDIAHAAVAWWHDAPQQWKPNLELPAYEGEARSQQPLVADP